jgi:DNA-nicking Smr family endonuclease
MVEGTSAKALILQLSPEARMPTDPESDDLHAIPIEDTIDLHSFRPRDVRAVVEEYLYQAVEKGLREIRLIHGRGIGVQREIVRSILEKHPDVVDFEDMPDRGSTLVTLRVP